MGEDSNRAEGNASGKIEESEHRRNAEEEFEDVWREYEKESRLYSVEIFVRMDFLLL